MPSGRKPWKTTADDCRVARELYAAGIEQPVIVRLLADRGCYITKEMVSHIVNGRIKHAGRYVTRWGSTLRSQTSAITDQGKMGAPISLQVDDPTGEV
jgi:hypothetical protein